MPARVPTSAIAMVTLALLTGGCAAATPPPVDAPTAGSSSASPATPATPTTAAGPVAAWRLAGDGSGDPGPDLAFTGGSRVGGAGVVLDGTTGYGSTPGGGPLDTTRSFTVAAWVSLDEVRPFATAVSQVGDVAAAFYLGRGEEGWAFSMKDADTNDPGHTTRAQAPASSVRPGAWTHLAGVFDAQEGRLRLYVDGTLAATTAFTAPWRAAGELRVGAAQAHAGLADTWPGAIRDVVAYQDVLDADAVGRLAESSRPVSAPAAWVDDVAVPEALRGTWDAVVGPDEMDRFAELLGSEAAARHGVPGADTRIRIGFDGNRWWLGFVFDGTLWLENGVPEGDHGIMTVTGDEMRQTNGSDGWITYRWAIDGDTLTLAFESCVPQSGRGTCADADVVRFITERTYTRSGNDPAY